MAAVLEEIYTMSFVKKNDNTITLRKYAKRNFTDEATDGAQGSMVGGFDPATGAIVPISSAEIQAAIAAANIATDASAVDAGVEAARADAVIAKNWGGKRRTKYARSGKRGGKSRKHRASRK